MAPLAAAVLAAALLIPQLARVFGRAAGGFLALAIAAALGGAWWLLALAGPVGTGPADWSAVGSVPSAECARCHPSQHASWHRSFHRTMTRDAAPDTVKGEFGVTVDALGVRSRLITHKDGYYLETVPPAPARGQGPALFRIDRVVGSHWIQECLTKEPNGRYQRLPLLYHIGERRWLPSVGAFLAPDTDDFWAQCRGDAWNDTCLYCHNTAPAKAPVMAGGRPAGYETRVAELGIACEACHGPAATHVAANANPARRLAVREAGAGDPTIVHPLRLPAARRDHICARCHGALVPRREAWDRRTQKDPFIAGQDLGSFNRFFHSEAEQAALAGLPKADPPAIDGRFWGDGTPLTTALEYNGMTLSACHQAGGLSCTSCHTMHGDDPNHQLKPGMRTNEACYGCHEGFRAGLTRHTRHAADSPGSLCYNCHMPHVVYSLMDTHRSHRIETPDVKTSRDTGKPHACNLCHLDKPLAWTQEHRPGPAAALSPEERSTSHALLLLARGDARSRVMAAGAFSSADARRASGSAWLAPVLLRLLENERYPAVRYLMHRALREAHGEAAGPYDYMAAPALRSAQLAALRARLDTPLRPTPGLPVTPAGRVDEAALRRLLDARNDPDLSIHE